MPSVSRHTVHDIGDSKHVTLSPRRNLLFIIWYVFTVVIWALMSVQVLAVLVIMIGGATGLFGIQAAEGAARIALVGSVVFLLGPVAFILTFGALTIHALAWELFGEERIEVDRLVLNVTRNLLGFRVTREYPLGRVRNLRVLDDRRDFALARSVRRLLARDGTVGFDDGETTIRFGVGIKHAEAEQILGVIRNRLQEPLEHA